MAVVLEDIGSNKICCVLFGDLVDQIVPVLSQESVEPVIVVLQYFKATRWDEKTSIQSNFDVSGLHINPDLKVVDEFRTIILTGENSNGVRITPMEYQSAVSGEKNVWIFGKIVVVNARKTDWCYKACIKCPKKFERKPEDEFDCKRCKINFEESKDRYK
ncbi:hypothetical protein PIB30_098761, partial [Stylosanthes scabra]|nr:hypothetical protein [Stylosanthes scabra]